MYINIFCFCFSFIIHNNIIIILRLLLYINQWKYFKKLYISIHSFTKLLFGCVFFFFFFSYTVLFSFKKKNINNKYTLSHNFYFSFKEINKRKEEINQPFIEQNLVDLSIKLNKDVVITKSNLSNNQVNNQKITNL